MTVLCPSYQAFSYAASTGLSKIRLSWQIICRCENWATHPLHQLSLSFSLAINQGSFARPIMWCRFILAIEIKENRIIKRRMMKINQLNKLLLSVLELRSLLSSDDQHSDTCSKYERPASVCGTSATFYYFWTDYRFACRVDWSCNQDSLAATVCGGLGLC